jgi:hypothetical protein
LPSSTNSGHEDIQKRGIVLDVSHLVTRLNCRATTGIDRVDLAYARHFAGKTQDCFRYALWPLFPHVLSPQTVSSLVDLFETVQLERERSDRPEWRALLARLKSNSISSVRGSERSSSIVQRATLFARQSTFRVRQDWQRSIPVGAIYLSVAQHAFEHDRFFNWLNRRTDVLPVFLVHDLIRWITPSFSVGLRSPLPKRIKTILTYGRAIITTTSHVAERLREEYRRHGRQPVPHLHRTVTLTSRLERNAGGYRAGQ